ncbi:hypothetical protein FOMPIDRAFT_84174 [Fomitopsis schrenkii]|uniref:Carboxylic ester hydrolase n=1 Tax=Fomitopsis schrenkii TaxID=2126942 RepID=S8EQI2_FOMSC|nr:hypothetical protein FOMPIDRAFT_84174 [Fomitopsis schrenkii]
MEITQSFLFRIPFAEPPVGNLRFAPPRPLKLKSWLGVRNATTYGAACLQQNTSIGGGAGQLPFKLPSFTYPIANVTPIQQQSEDCLFINVVTPAQIHSTKSGLPVLMWFFGGGYETGDSSSFPGAPIVERSLVLDEPVIFVSANYRLNAFGFLASEEVQQAGATNLGLRDQQLAMQWVHEYISAFGGDPNKVIIWGESAGSESAGYHLLMNNGSARGLFRGALMESGTPHAIANVSAGQGYYDQLVQSTNCAGAENTLQCLRTAPVNDIWAAVNATPSIVDYQSTDLVWQPRVDGDLIPYNPSRMIQNGEFAKVPIVAGDCEDEGTIFALSDLNVTTDEEFKQYIQEYYLPNLLNSDIEAVAQAYSPAPSLGSPFGTGDKYNITPQYKRMAAFKGDVTFQAPRRHLLKYMSQVQPTWGFRFRRNAEPYIGVYHSADIPEFFTEIDYIGMDALIYFANYLDPNAPNKTASSISPLANISWPSWNSSLDAPPLLTFLDPAPSVNITADTYRVNETDLLTSLFLQSP